ncbi:MAG TPA: tetratricopeptide repeat protein [Methylomirabilota bacterium]|nr:tetratricopeptide repeat protein [Methylomirabilota bacterium]
MKPTSLRVVVLALGALVAWPSLALAVAEPERLWTVGDRAFQDGLHGVSRRMLERLIERYPTDGRVPDATLLLGKVRLSQGQHEAALQAFRQAQGFSPPPGRPEEARFWEGETLFRMKRFPEARAVYDRILADNPTSPSAPDAVYGLAWVNLELKRRDQAVTEFRRLLSSYPEHANVPSATFYLARTLAELKRADEAAGLLRSFVAKYPDHRLLPDARYMLGQALIAGGQTDEGVAELRAFAKAYPGHELSGAARRQVVDTLVRQGKKGELAEEYKVLVAQSPATPESLYDAGVVAGKLGRPRDADTAWARLRKDFPDHPLTGRVSLEMAQSAFAKNSFKDASTLARAAARSPEDAVRGEAFVLLGESELKQRRHTAAISAFKSAADAQALEPGMRYRALAGTGLAHEEQRQYRQAAKYYEEVAAKSPDKTLAAWAKERLTAVNAAAAAEPAPAPKPTPKKSPPKKSSPKAPPGARGAK